MKRYYDNLLDKENPSSQHPNPSKKEKFILPQDPEAEKLIVIKDLTTDMLIDNHFQGIDLMAYDGTPFTRTFLATSLNSAIAKAEALFDICITPREIIDEMHDYDNVDPYRNYQYTPLFKRPVQTIHNFRYFIGNQKVMDIPSEWIQLEKRMGDVTIFPTGGYTQMIAPAPGTVVPRFMGRGYMPMSIRVSYRAGMDRDEIPENLMDWIYKTAAITIFEVWGDQIIGAGIASSSLSLDGISQSIGTTQSAMYGGASARILEYRKDLEEMAPIIRKQFARFESVVL